MNSLELFQSIRLFVFDMDGVLTDGSLVLTPDEEQLRTMNIKDGYAIKRAVDCGYTVLTITGSHSDPAVARLRHLGVSQIFTRVEHKEQVLQEFLTSHPFSFEETLYMGDDMPDFLAMQLCALPTCPSDACIDIRQVAKYISPFAGGHGCVRDVIEKVLKLNQDWNEYN